MENNLNRKKIAIIDPVGKKAGMNYYNIGLLEALSKQEINTFLFSNEDKAPKIIKNYNYFDDFIDNKIRKALGQICAYLKSFLVCKIKRIDFVVMHVFSVNFFYKSYGLPYQFFQKIPKMTCVLLREFDKKDL